MTDGIKAQMRGVFSSPEETRMTKEAITHSLSNLMTQPTGVASMGSGTLGVVTSFAESITPLVPALSLLAMVVFGIINVMTNRRKLKLLEKEHGDK